MSVCIVSTLNRITCDYQRCTHDAGKNDVYCARHRLMLAGVFSKPLSLTTEDKLRNLQRQLQRGK